MNARAISCAGSGLRACRSMFSTVRAISPRNAWLRAGSGLGRISSRSISGAKSISPASASASAEASLPMSAGLTLSAVAPFTRARERLADRALGRSPSSSGKPWITLGSLLLRSASSHVFGHDGVITDLQLGVIHRQQTAQPSPRRHAHDARPQMPVAKAAALPTRTKSLSSQLHQTLLMEKFSIRMRKPSPPSMQRFVRYRRSLSGKPLLSRLFGRRVDALILDRAAVLAREL